MLPSTGLRRSRPTLCGQGHTERAPLGPAALGPQGPAVPCNGGPLRRLSVDSGIHGPEPTRTRYRATTGFLEGLFRPCRTEPRTFAWLGHGPGGL